MLELTLASLLNTMSADFCALMEKDGDVVKSTFLAYSMANKQYGPDNVIKIIDEATPLQIKSLAVSSVITKCPDKL
jgi:hypothetical protein